MNSEIKATWVAALRSGEYEQGSSRLRNGNHFCCLGVLCDIAVKAGIGEWSHTIADGDEFMIPTLLGSADDSDYFYKAEGDVPTVGLLSHTIIQWAGLEVNNPSVQLNNRKEALTCLNDILGFDFKRIADIIEEQL